MIMWLDSLAGSKKITFMRAAILAVLIVLIRLVLLAIITDKRTFLPIDDVLFTLASGIAAIGMFYASRHSEGRSRIAWLMLTAAQLVYTFGEAAWTVTEVVLHQNPFMSVADIGYFAFYPIFVLSVIILPSAPLSSRERLKILLDVGITVSAFTLIFWAFVIAPIIASGEALTIRLAVSAAYPIMDVLLFVATMELIFKKLSSSSTAPFSVLAIGLVVLLITDVIFSIQTQAGTYASGGLLDTGWLMSYMLFFLAGILQASTMPFDALAALNKIYDRRAAGAQYLSYLGIGATFSFLDWGYQNSLYVDKSIVSMAICIIFVLMFIRQKVMLDESNQLLAITQSAIIQRNQADEAYQESEDRYHSVVEQASDIILLFDLETMRLLEGNLAFHRLLNYSIEEVNRLNIYDIIIDDRDSIDNNIEKIKENKQYVVGRGKYRKKDGSLLDVEVAINLISYRRRTVFCAVARDLTERNKAENALKESENRYRAIFENTGTATVIVEDNTTISLANSEFGRLTGYSKEEIEGKISWTEFVVNDDLQRMLELHKLRRMDPDSAMSSYEFKAKDRNGQIKDILLHVDIIPGTKKSIASWTDITAHKRSEEMLRASLDEKEVLLKEVHHRVKNNLQVISSLLYLQSLNLTDNNIIKIFQDSQNRIKSMALIHENLYRSNDLGNVDFNEYIKQMISYLSQSYGEFSRKISFKIYSNNIYMNINTAIPCGMIINELISNSLKYAFPDDRRGEVCISASYESENFKLMVSDNGVGIKCDPNIKDAKTLGFRLIDTLVKQIDGNMRLDTTNGTRCEIKFKGLK